MKPLLVMAGDRVLASSGSLDAAGPQLLSYDPASDGWSRLAPVPATPSALVWTGRQLFAVPLVPGVAFALGAP